MTPLSTPNESDGPPPATLLLYDAWGNRIEESEDLDGDVGVAEVAAVANHTQYASSVIAVSSQYSTAYSSADQALVSSANAGASPYRNNNAWAASAPDAGTEYLTIAIADPVSGAYRMAMHGFHGFPPTIRPIGSSSVAG